MSNNNQKYTSLDSDFNSTRGSIASTSHRKSDIEAPSIEMT
jgi:hypothetical protein